MLPRLPRTIITCLLLVSCWLARDVRPAAAADPSPQNQPPLKVVVMQLEPFVIKDGERLAGFSIDAWQDVARRLGESYKYVVVESVDQQLQAVKQGDADVAIGAISMTAEREKVIDFSHGYYLSGLQIITLRHIGLDLVEGILKVVPGLLVLVGLLLLIIFVFAHVVWLAERKSNHQIPMNYWRGVGEAVWYLAVTLTTVGYGDVTPKTRFGRVSGIVWMFVGLFLIAGFTGAVASQFTVDRLESNINGIDDLAGKRVGTVQETTADQFLTEHKIPHDVVADLDSAIQGLAGRRFDAVVFDAPVLAYYLTIAPKGKFELVGSPFDQQSYAIALPEGSEYRNRIDIALLEMLEDGTFDELRQKWFGERTVRRGLSTLLPNS